MLTIWVGESSRPTRDIDLLGITSNSVEEIVAMIKAVCVQTVEADGLEFDPASVGGELIAEHAEYEGVRVTFKGNLGTAGVPMQIDIGFGDVVSPAPEEIDYPTILDFPPPRLLSYPRQSVVAEKFETMVRLGEVNSRMKDFYDIWKLSRQFRFDGPTLQEAVSRTFAQRGTPIQPKPVALTPEFGAQPQKQTQWRAFSRVSRVEDAPEAFDSVTRDLNAFLGPIAEEISAGSDLGGMWEPPGPWSRSSSSSGEGEGGP